MMQYEILDMMEEKFDILYFLTHKENGYVSYKDDCIKTDLFEFGNTYVKQMEPDYPQMVCTQMIYNENTLKLASKGQYLKHGGVGIGIWEYYNEDGTLNHTENLDKHFPITWDKMEEKLKDKDISLLTAHSIFRYYDEKKDEATWSIIISLPMEKGCLYVFDAKTGELINEEIVDMSKEL